MYTIELVLQDETKILCSIHCVVTQGIPNKIIHLNIIRKQLMLAKNVQIQIIGYKGGKLNISSLHPFIFLGYIHTVF